MSEVKFRVAALAKSLAKSLGWSPDRGSPWDKVVGIFSYNTIDFLIACWAIHRIGGTCLLLHSTSSASEILPHLEKANCNIIFTCQPLMQTCEEVNKTRSIQLFLFDLPNESPDPVRNNQRLAHLVEEGSDLSDLPDPAWGANQGADKVAYLCPTSGTSGKQKLAQITHFNVIANVVQSSTFENGYLEGRTEVVSGVLPLSHSYGLILGHMSAWRGDCVILHPRFDMQVLLQSIAPWKIERLYLVPAIIAALTANSFLFEIYDVSSVKSVVTGSAPFGPRMAEALKAVQPNWQVSPGYGLTESGVIVSITSPKNPYLGSDGCLIPLVQARLVTEDGKIVDSIDQSGELLLRSPSIMKGYLGDDAANRSTFDPDGWLRTGDVAVFKKDARGSEHLFIVDRKKDIMKVKGLQISSAEIETQLLCHPAVDEAAVVSMPDDDAGERPFAFIVRSAKVMAELDEKDLKKEVSKLIEETMSEPHWLRKNVAVLEEIPKSHNGKALKFKLKALLSEMNV
ncbi:hypothetical protein ACLMJK_009553 [Lecanora helva]